MLCQCSFISKHLPHRIKCLCRLSQHQLHLSQGPPPEMSKSKYFGLFMFSCFPPPEMSKSKCLVFSCFHFALTRSQSRVPGALVGACSGNAFLQMINNFNANHLLFQLSMLNGQDMPYCKDLASRLSVVNHHSLSINIFRTLPHLR